MKRLVKYVATMTVALLVQSVVQSTYGQVSQQTELSNATYHAMHAGVTTTKTASKTKTLTSSASAKTMSMNGSGGPAFSLPNYSLPAACDCYTNSRVTYGLPDFNGNSWITSFDNWGISQTVLFDPTKSEQCAASANPGLYAKASTHSQLWHSLQINADTNGNPSWHSLDFWYQFGESRQGDQFTVGMMINGLTYWLRYTNLPYAGDWTRVKLALPAYDGAADIMFDVYKEVSPNSGTGPRAYIAAVQLCTITTYPTKGDLVIRKSTNYTDVVAWNLSTFPPPRYVLSCATNVVGTFTTNIGVSVLHTGLTAYAVFPSTNRNKFFGISKTY